MRQRIFSYEEDGSAAIVHPKLRALHDLWNEKRGTRQAPSRSDFTVEELHPWLGHLLVLDCLDDGDFRYRLYGTGLVQIFGFDLTGRTLSEACIMVGDKPLLEYRQVRRVGAPVHASRVSPSAREYLKVDKLALPLMEGGAVNKILGAIYLSDSAT